MKSPDAFERLEALLQQKSYAELSARERQWLTEQDIDAEAYARQRQLLKSAHTVFAELLSAPLPSPVLRTALRARRNSRPFQTSWKGAAVAAALIGCFLLGRWSVAPTSSPSPVPEIIVETIEKTDTVYLEREVTVPSPPEVRYRERVVRDTIYLPLPVANASAPELSAPDGSILPITRLEARQDWSRNANATEQLLKVLVEVY